MTNFTKIAIIGCGGIGSWNCENLKKMLNVFYPNNDYYIKLFDEDIVEEKNILQSNQNFVVDDLLENKAQCLSKKYNYDYEGVFITEDNIDEKLKMFNYVMISVDNNKVRRLIYEFCINKGITFIDLRAQGTQIQYIVKDNNKNMEYYDKTYFNNAITMERKGSCQLQGDIERQHIENGNKIISYLGIWGIFLKLIRKEILTTYEYKWVY